MKTSLSYSLKDRAVLVTGATGYLGREICFGLGEAGASLLVNSRRMEPAQNLCVELRKSGIKCIPAVFDVTDKESVESFFLRVASTNIHCIVNNAYAGKSGSLEISADEDYVVSYQVAVVAAHNILVASLPNLRAARKADGDASIINVASMYGIVSPDQRVYLKDEVVNPPFYGAAKAALIQWTRYAACEFGAEGIRVNAISPGPFPSDIVKRENPQFVKRLSDKVPLCRVAEAHEIRGPVVFLASKMSSFVTGANIVVDGGWTVW